MRKIIHIDMDCFFAAIEMRDNPQLRNVPMAVGGLSEGRGVLCTANYLARKYGVGSAMPTARALKLCPDLVLVRPHSRKYKEASDIIKNIFTQYTDQIEPLSLDEAYLDVSHVKFCHGSAQLLAQEIRQKIYKETELTASAGVSVNKFVAKVASDWNKPNGICVVKPDQIHNFVSSLPVERIPGVGKVTAVKMHQLGLKTCSDLQRIPLSFLNLHFGKFGTVLFDRCRGIDNRRVEVSRERKSLSIERTFSEDKDIDELLEVLPSLEAEFSYRLEKLLQKKDYQCKQLFIKLKFSDFKVVTCEQKKDAEFLMPLNQKGLITEDIHNFLKELIEFSWNKSELKVRLMGIGSRFQVAKETPSGQLSLFAS